MKIIKYILICLLLISTSLVSVSQNNTLVYIKDGDFIKDCSIWKPKILNYIVTLSKLPNNSTIVSPNIGGFNILGSLRCSTATDGIARLKADFQYMKDLNVDAVRIAGIEVEASESGELNVRSKHFSSYYGHASQYLFNINGATEQNKLIDHIETVLDIAAEFDIKVILLVGKDSDASTSYINYLSNLAARLKYNSALFAFDMYNEPAHSSRLKTKVETYQLTNKWYSTIRSTGDNHLITIGNLSYADVVSWDPHILKVDFYSFHIYPESISDFNIHTKWFDEVLNKPWIIGEIGKSGHNNTICTETDSEFEQEGFAISTMNSTFDCNGKGYSWWKYHDGSWCNDLSNSCVNSTCEHNYFGIINKGSDDNLILDPSISPILNTQTSNPLYSIQGSPKQLAFAFRDYVYNENVCSRPSDYYTAFSGDKYASPYLGKVIDGNGIPIANAVIHAWYKVSDEYYNTFTFSDDNGVFAIYPKNSSHSGTLYAEMSYPGKNIIKHYFTSHNLATIVLSDLGYDASSYFNSEIVIASGANELWLNDRSNISNITVDNNASLTIKSNIKMLPDGKITVNTGGKLIIDGGTITSDCGLWQGIAVQGNISLLQTPETNQGVLEMKNGATIQNARLAVSAGISLSYPPINSSGGIIKINNAVFLNNQKDILMTAYKKSISNYVIPQKSYIKNSSFKNNANMLVDALTSNKKLGAIYLYDISTISISGNTFENLDNSLATISKGIGIEISNSSVNIESACNPDISPCDYSLPNKFINLYQGIRVINGSNANDLVKIYRNTFTNTYKAIFLSGTNNALVLENDIASSAQAPMKYGMANPGRPYGIYINGGTGFRVEENTIHRPSYNFPTMFNGARGIIVNNTGGLNNEIYKNTLTNLFISNDAQMHNSGQGVDSDLGLKYFCNTSQTNSNSYDFQTFGGWYITFNTPCNISLYRSGIAEFQIQSIIKADGTPLIAPAANQFSAKHPINESSVYDFDNGEAQEITYYWANLTTTGEKWEPTEVDNVLGYQMSDVQYDDVCPSKITKDDHGNNNPTDLYANLSIAQISYNSSKLILNIWKDGGNSNLGEEVRTVQPWDVYVEFNNLLSRSPYLSEGVMLEAINNSAFTSLMIKLLMIANPHARESFEIMQALEERNPALPQSYISEIQSQPKVSSQLKVLEGNVAADYHLISNISSNIKRLYRANHSNSWAKDSLINFVSRQPNIYNKLELASIYLSYNDYDNAISTVEDIYSKFKITDEIAQELESFSKVLSIANTMNEQEGYENSLNETNINRLQAFVDNNQPMISPIALSLLKRNKPNYQYNEIVFDVAKNSARKASPQNHFSKEDLTTQAYKLYPNPTKDYTTLSYNCKLDNMNYSIVNNQGKLLLVKALATIIDLEQNETLIDLSNLASGTYQILIRSNNELLWSENIIISK